jgi:3',5'-cyclic AMP phosphodiesterase CpdA
VSFLLAHLSDPHIGPLPRPRLRELAGKRLTGYLNWQQRSAFQDMDVLNRLVADLKAQKPDHIAMTGDIMNIGLPAEFPRARAWLETLGDPHDVSFVPGNHDAYVKGSMPWLAGTFGPWTSDEDRVHAAYPYMRVRGEVAIIGLSSGVPTAPFIASGRLGRIQRAAFARLLDEAAARGLARVVLIHHPPYRKGATPGRGLTDSRAFGAIVARHGADLILHGHNHRSHVARLRAPGGEALVVGVGSASAVPGTPRHRAIYHLYRIARARGRWEVTTSARGLLPGTRVIGPLEPPLGAAAAA